ncbi:L-idonate 5-dehydrogenase [Agromyces archimandritae]|uniref:L-idonate 5-dehydrogenase n=1 Tax=Agromyces archimandritae TaxID=2781962 RepID=A0A975FRF8_9MICO|nr:L-idonate 5-dehydrogenase [Agromyces archimandritae]QTX05866.1 L-idonate 5-dehydrogenase [Agromyces archimandritae]
MSSEPRTVPSLAVVAHAAGDLRIESIATPAPAPDEAVVRIAYGGICGSDLHYWQHGAAGDSVLREPMILGHEIVGTVVRPAADGSGPPEGANVAVHPGTPHDTGEPYPAERPNLAPGGTYLGSAARHPHTDGAFRREAVLPARMLRELPDGLTLRTAAIAEPAAVAWHAVSRAGGVAGRRVLVIGAGPIGALVVAVLRRAGAAVIIATDLAERPLRVARGLGADRTLAAADPAVADLAADVVFETSGSHHGLGAALRGARRGGRIVMVGLLPSGEQPVPISLAITRELELVGAFRFNDELDEVLAALADGSLQTESVVSHVFPAANALTAFCVAADAARSGKVLLDFGEDAVEEEPR